MHASLAAAAPPQFIVSAYCEEVDRLEEEGKKSEADLVRRRAPAPCLCSPNSFCLLSDLSSDVSCIT